MKKVVISGSIKLQKEIDDWREYFSRKDYEVVDYPKQIKEERFMEIYPDVFRDFMKHISEADILFVMNEDRDGKRGYIGAETFAELCFGIIQKQVYHRNIELVILKLPDKNVQCYDEINLWLKLGWIRLYHEEETQ